jgi:hypothetical protein
VLLRGVALGVYGTAAGKGRNLLGTIGAMKQVIMRRTKTEKKGKIVGRKLKESKRVILLIHTQ